VYPLLIELLTVATGVTGLVEGVSVVTGLVSAVSVVTRLVTAASVLSALLADVPAVIELLMGELLLLALGRDVEPQAPSISVNVRITTIDIRFMPSPWGK
jgi:hypothetical protein